MIPNRGAAAHKGAVKRCQGCRQGAKYCIFCLFIKVLPLRVIKIAIFSQVRVPAIFFNSKGCREQKRLKNTGTLDGRALFHKSDFPSITRVLKHKL